MNNDDVNKVPKNVSTVIDLLDDHGISWAEYQEDMPYTGFEGKQYLNSQGANDYVRKHNPAVIYDANALSPDRLAKMKNLTYFYKDLAEDKLPQWMFITPNMTSDGHDTDVTTAGKWTRDFLEPLLTDSKFMKRTLVLITFDENHTYTEQNRVLGILLGDAVPQNLVGTTDTAYYNHYSEISTVQSNWGLDTLGRWDVGANVFSFVGGTQEKVREWKASPGLSQMYFNSSYAGIFNSKKKKAVPPPNTSAEYAGRTVLPKIIDTWGSSGQTYYTTGLEIPDGQHPPQGYST